MLVLLLELHIWLDLQFSVNTGLARCILLLAISYIIVCNLKTNATSIAHDAYEKPGMVHSCVMPKVANVAMWVSIHTLIMVKIHEMLAMLV